MYYENLFDKRLRYIPDYYDTMYMDGFEPWEIMYAHDKMIRKKYSSPTFEPMSFEEAMLNLHLTTEVKLK